MLVFAGNVLASDVVVLKYMVVFAGNVLALDVEVLNCTEIHDGIRRECTFTCVFSAKRIKCMQSEVCAGR